MSKIFATLVLLLSTPLGIMAQAPQITQQPVAQTVTEGQSAQFSVVATGSNLVYEWAKDGTALVNGGRISGVGATILTISGVQEVDEGTYSVLVSVSGSPELKERSTGALLKVNPPTPPGPQITQHPTGQTVTEGQNAQFSVMATGANLVYQWAKDGEALVDGARISGASGTTLTINAAQETDEGSYSVVVSVSGFPELKASSNGALLKVNPPIPPAPQITQQPVPQTVLEGQNAQFAVAATGTNLLYTWAKDGAVLTDGGRVSGAATATLTINAVQEADEGSYSVVVSVQGFPELKASSDGVLLVAINPTVAQPTISPPGGDFIDAVQLTLATTTAGAEIRYTTNGAEPTSVSTLFQTPFLLTTTSMVKAKGFKAGFNSSPVAQAVFTITPSPTLSLSDTTENWTSAGGNFQFSVNSNTTWTWALSGNTGGWVTVSEVSPQTGNQIFSYSIAANTSASPRNAAITFSASGVPSVAHSISQTGTTDDHGNTTATATTVALNTNIAGNIETASDVDFFRIILSNPGDLAVESTGGLDAHGYLYNSAGALLLENDDTSGMNFSLFLAGAVAGTYYVKVEEHGQDAIGAYGLQVSINDQPLLSAPTLLGPSHGAQGVSTAPTFNWTAVPGAERYWLTVSTNPSDLPTDPDAISCPGCVASGLSGVTFATTYTAPAPFVNGTPRILSPNTVYYWQVQGYVAGGIMGRYSAVSSFTTGSVSPDDHGNTIATATVIAPTAGFATGEMTLGDSDYFRITIPGPGLVIAWTEGTVDTLGTLYDQSGSTLAPEVDDAGDRNFRISAPVTPGNVFLKVSGYNDQETGNYTVRYLFMPAGSPFRITFVGLTEWDEIMLGFPSVAGTSYSIETAINVAGPWTSIEDIIGDGSEILFYHLLEDETPLESGFFRVRSMPAPPPG